MSDTSKEAQEPRDVRLTVLVSDGEDSDIRLVASFHKRDISGLLREWAMGDIRAEAETIRQAVAVLAGAGAAADGGETAS